MIENFIDGFFPQAEGPGRKGSLINNAFCLQPKTGFSNSAAGIQDRDFPGRQMKASILIKIAKKIFCFQRQLKVHSMVIMIEDKEQASP